MVFLELYYYNKVTNKTPKNLIKEGIKSSLKSKQEITSEDVVLEIKMENGKYDDSVTFAHLRISNCEVLMGKKEMEEDMNIDEDMGLYEGVQESMLEHEDKKIDEEMEIDEGVEVMHKTVGSFSCQSL